MSSNGRWLGAWANGTIGPQPQPQAPLSGHILLLPTTHPYDYTPLAVKLLSCHRQDGMGIVDDFFKSVTQEPSEHPYFFARRGRAWGAFLKLNSKRKQLFMPDTYTTPLPSPPSSKNSDCGRENTAREDNPKQDENKTLGVERLRALGPDWHCQHSQNIWQEGRARQANYSPEELGIRRPDAPREREQGQSSRSRGLGAEAEGRSRPWATE